MILGMCIILSNTALPCMLGMVEPLIGQFKLIDGEKSTAVILAGFGKGSIGQCYEGLNCLGFELALPGKHKGEGFGSQVHGY